MYWYWYNDFDFPEATACRKNNKVLFPEFELVIETETDDSAAYNKSEKDRLDEYKQFVKSKDLLGDSDNDKELESLATLGKEALLADKQFRKFKKRVTREPKQVCFLVSRWKEDINLPYPEGVSLLFFILSVGYM